MSNLFMYSVYDSAAKAFLPPFTFPTKDMAVREFRACANDDAHAFCKYASDYTLFEVGEFNPETGVITETVPALLFTAVALKTVISEEV